jgi:hypothetical protein
MRGQHHAGAKMLSIFPKYTPVVLISILTRFLFGEEIKTASRKPSFAHPLKVMAIIE